jgi:hypothetical protein
MAPRVDSMNFQDIFSQDNTLGGLFLVDMIDKDWGLSSIENRIVSIFINQSIVYDSSGTTSRLSFGSPIAAWSFQECIFIFVGRFLINNGLSCFDAGSRGGQAQLSHY